MGDRGEKATEGNKIKEREKGRRPNTYIQNKKRIKGKVHVEKESNEDLSREEGREERHSVQCSE